MKTYKKAWKFVGKYKPTMIILTLCMIGVQFFTMLSPYIISVIIDDYIVGVTYPYVEVQEADNYTVQYHNAFYKQERYLDSNDQVTGELTLLMDGNYFYVIPEEVTISDGQERVIEDNYIYIDGVQYDCFQLTSSEVKDFYAPLIQPLIWVIVILFIVLFSKSILNYFQRILSAKITTEVTRDSRKASLKHLQYVDLNFIESEPVGKTANRVLTDSVSISSLWTTTLNIFFSCGFGIFFAYMFMFALDAKLAALCLLIIPIIIIWIMFFSKRINKIAIKSNETYSLMIAKTNEIINGINILKVFNQEKTTVNDFEKLNDKYLNEAMQEVNSHMTVGWNGVAFFQQFVGMLVILFFGYGNLQGTIAIEAGVVYAYYNYIQYLIAPVVTLFHSFGQLENDRVKVERISYVLEQPLEDATKNTKIDYNGLIEFKNLNFSYVENKQVLTNVNLTINPQEKVGIVGHTGSGKSTLMNLLLRFNNLSEDGGEILVDGVDIASLTKRTYRQDIGIILQEPILFSGTLYENICFSKYVSKEDAIKILKQLGGGSILEKLGNNIDAKITRKGSNLSLGEKQIISFARILVADPSIIVMDEATANIDTETENMISKCIQEVAKGRTMLVIAHRLSTIIDANQIIVMQKGEIIEQGNHKTLLSKDGLYAQMYNSQTML